MPPLSPLPPGTDAARAADRPPLSILYVVHGLPPDTWAGTEVYTLALAQEMRRRGHSVAIVARAPPRAGAGADDPPDWTIEAGELDGLPVWRVIRRVERLPIRESYRPARARAVFESLLERTRPDVVHFQHLLHLSAEWVLVARERALRTVITCNDYWPLCARVQLIRPDGVRCEENQGMGCLLCLKEYNYRRIPLARRWFPLAHPIASALRRVLNGGRRAADGNARAPRSNERAGRTTRAELAHQAEQWIALRERQDYVMGCFAAADLVICPSRFLRAKLAATGRFDPERLVHSDYGMRVPAVRALAKAAEPDGKIRFGFVGSLAAYKGIDVLVEAMSHLAGRPCRLHVFGDFRPDDDAFHAKLRDLARAGDVRFRGRFENSLLAEVYREIDVLVVPSVWFENSPLTIHEAFLQHTPVVASGIGGMAELVRDGIDGLHFRAGDARDLAAKLERFVDEPDLAARLSRDWMRVKTIAEDGDEMEARYRSLVARRTSRAQASAP